jgi:hypothetical protein
MRLSLAKGVCMGKLKDGLKHHLGEGIREFLVGLAANKVSGGRESNPPNYPKLGDELFYQASTKAAGIAEVRNHK